MNKVIRKKGKGRNGTRGGIFSPRVIPSGTPTGGAVPLNGRTACFIWAFWGDSDLTTAGQETMKLKKSMKDYHHKVLMKHNHTPSWIDLSEGDERNADVMLPPTPENFTSELVRLAQEGYMIDIFINSHGDTNEFHASSGSHHGPTRRITADRIRDLPNQAGLRKLPIRMVYQTQCYAASLNNDWIAAGAKVSTGARYIQFYPNQYGNFMNDWNNGRTVPSSNSGADGGWVRTQSQTYILGDARASRSRWGGCKFGNTVLGTKSCAKDYFTYRWLRENEWRDDLSGKQNMNYSSGMITAGNRNITKNSRNLRW